MKLNIFDLVIIPIVFLWFYIEFFILKMSFHPLINGMALASLILAIWQIYRKTLL